MDMSPKKPEMHPLNWCRALEQGAEGEIVISLYARCERQDDFFELGVAIAAGTLVRFQPLTYTSDAVRPGAMYEVYSFVADEYVETLSNEGYRARRLHAPFELALKEHKHNHNAALLRVTRFNV
jgi:hypothetical protein